MMRGIGLLLISFLLVLGPFTYQTFAKAQVIATPSTIKTAFSDHNYQYAMSADEEEDEGLNEENDEEYKEEEDNDGDEDKGAIEGDLGVDEGNEEAPGAQDSE